MISTLNLSMEEVRVRVLELVRWNSCGQGASEQAAQSYSLDKSFSPVGNDSISLLLRQKGYPLQGVRNTNYYVFYQYHPSSGYRTEVYVDGEGIIKYKTESPKGGVLCAFFSEVIIFTLTDRLI
jgi:hypothetical protein